MIPSARDTGILLSDPYMRKCIVELFVRGVKKRKTGRQEFDSRRPADGYGLFISVPQEMRSWRGRSASAHFHPPQKAEPPAAAI